MTELATVDWSRAQFALTSIYHFLFVPLTLGLSFIIAIMNTIYYKTNSVEWLKITKFWMSLFAINFAIGVATGLVMEFEFGTNWANYSWFVGDIFGAPLAIEGILAFFMESTFFAVMFFGWNKVSKGFHLLSTWLVAIGSNLSAFWILIANGWMQYPVGMNFNPETMRNEMHNFWDVALSPVAIAKFLHTAASGYVISAIFVIGISSWYLIKNKNTVFAKKSIIVAASFGLLTSIFLLYSGDDSAYEVAQKQPMKLASMEGLYDGRNGAGIVAIGILNTNKKAGDNLKPYLFDIEIPYALSILGYRDLNAFVPGINDIVYGNEKYAIASTNDRMQSGKIAIDAIKNYHLAKAQNDLAKQNESKILIQENFHNLGYGYLNNANDIVPNVPLVFYSFHIMVLLGCWFLLLFIIVLYLTLKKDISQYKTILWAALITIPFGYIAAEAGWIVAEVGRQPWVVQDLLPVNIAATNLSDINIKISFVMFAILFTILLIAEVKIMLKQISIGFEKEHK